MSSYNESRDYYLRLHPRFTIKRVYFMEGRYLKRLLYEEKVEAFSSSDDQIYSFICSLKKRFNVRAHV